MKHCGIIIKDEMVAFDIPARIWKKESVQGRISSFLGYVFGLESRIMHINILSVTKETAFLKVYLSYI